MRWRIGPEYITKNAPSDSGLGLRDHRASPHRARTWGDTVDNSGKLLKSAAQGPLRRISAERACAVRPSPCARVEANGANTRAPCGEQPMSDVRF